jgi:hypothetical protein
MRIIDLFKKRISTTKEVIKKYMNQDNIVQGNNSIKISLKETVYKLIRIWQLHIVVPIIAIVVLIAYLLKHFIVQFLALGVVWVLIYEHFHKPKPQINHENRYKWMKDFIYKPLSHMDKLLPIESIQSLYDISSPEKFLIENDCILYVYQLMKSTSETIDKSKLDFARKVLQERLNKKMDKYDEYYGVSNTVYLDARVLTVTDITDMGTHYIVKILYIDSPLAYKYWQYINTPKPSSAADTYDEDF